MRDIMLAIPAMAFAALAPFALAADGRGTNTAKQPTMAELKAKMDGISTEIAALAATVGNLSTAAVTKLDTLSSTVTANHTTIVGKLAQQVAVVMTVPISCPPRDSGRLRCTHRMYLMGGSTIAGFPVSVNAYHQFTDTTLPIGTYLFELRQPYSDNLVCGGDAARRVETGVAAADAGSPWKHCPRLHVDGAGERLHNGSAVWRFNEHHRSFRVTHRFPNAFAFTDDNPVTSYAGSVRITKLK